LNESSSSSFPSLRGYCQGTGWGCRLGIRFALELKRRPAPLRVPVAGRPTNYQAAPKGAEEVLVRQKKKNTSADKPQEILMPMDGSE
jgi:hypothetical protein